MIVASRSAFTLVELLVSITVLAIIVMFLAAMTNQTAMTWRYTAGKSEQFSSARNAFESINVRLSQSVMNTYYDYYNANGDIRTQENAATFVPATYGRQSELRFVSGGMSRANRYGSSNLPPLALDASRARPTHGIFFHAPLGRVMDTQTRGDLKSLLNVWGYYVEFDSDQNSRPPFLQGVSTIPLRWRYRLMEFMQPSESLTTYSMLANSNPLEWFQTGVNAVGTPNAHILAENVIALVIQPMLSPKDEQALANPPSVAGTALAPSYYYDSTKKNSIAALSPWNQLPPIVRVTMVAVDEQSALRLANDSNMPDFGLDNLFATDAADTAESCRMDLDTLQKSLAGKHCSFRVFTSDVVIRAAKWSNQ